MSAAVVSEKQKEIKCIVWDLDETVWEGILLEGGAAQLRPGVAELLETFDQRGILHSIASRNDHEAAMARLRELGIDHYFLYPEINWNAKSSSIARIRERLNLGIDTFMFVDDQPFERAEVADSLPQVVCWDAAELAALPGLDMLTPRFASDQARDRRRHYQEQIQREQAEESFVGPREEFLASLDMALTIHPAEEVDLQRAEELTVRTNQLNATGVTYSYGELDQFRQRPGCQVLICQLTDRFGDYGKIGLALFEEGPEFCHLRLLLMSCRVMSRGVGSVLLTYLMRQSQAAGKPLRADFIKTGRNRMMFVTYRFAGFRQVEADDDGRLVLQHDLAEIPEFPSYLKLNLP